MLAIDLETVQNLFDRYSLLDGQVRFLKGWFKDTLPSAPIEKLALLRLDGDLYESTRDALNALYHKVVPGGFVIIDDYGCLAPCRRAVDEFREKNKIAEPLTPVDWTAVYWQRG
jgi:O-methyltransferase